VDPVAVKQMAWYLSLGCGGVAVVAAILGIVGNRARDPGWGRAAVMAATGGGVLAVIALIVMSRIPSGAGHKGIAAAFAMGAILLPLGALLTALRHPLKRDTGEWSDAPAPLLLPGMFVLGMGVLAAGLVANRYGIRANGQFMGLTLGLSLGWVWTLLCIRSVSPWRYAEATASMLTGAALAALSVPQVAVIAGMHFPWPSTAPWFTLYCATGMLAGWILTFVSVAVVSRGSGSTAATVVGAGVMAAALGAAAWSAQVNIVTDDRLVPTLAAGLLGALLAVAIASSARWVEEAHTVDHVAAISLAFVLLGVCWVSFKLWLGLGMAVAALGFLAAFPVAAALGAAAPPGISLSERVCALGGGALLLLAGMKIFQEAAHLGLEGIDIADGNVTAALVAGMIVPIVFEACVPHREGEGAIPAAVSVLGRFLACAVLVGVTVVGGALYFGVDGVAAMLTAIAMWCLLAATSISATGREGGLVTFRALPLATSTLSLAVLLVPATNLLSAATRHQKIQILIAITVVAAIALAVSGALGRKAPQGAEQKPRSDRPGDESLAAGQDA